MTNPPTLPEIFRLKVGQSIGAKYHKLGVFLLNDDNGARLDSFEHQYCRDPEQICRKIFSEWLQGNGRRPVTWETLIITLRESELSTLADEIEDAKM